MKYTNHGIYDHLYAFTLKSCPMKWPYTVICTLSSCFLRFASAKYILLLMKQWKEKNKYIRKEEIRRCVNPDIGGFYILFVKYSSYSIYLTRWKRNILGVKHHLFYEVFLLIWRYRFLSFDHSILEFKAENVKSSKNV